MDVFRDVVVAGLVLLSWVTFGAGFLLGHRRADRQNLAERDAEQLAAAEIEDARARGRLQAKVISDVALRDGRD